MKNIKLYRTIIIILIFAWMSIVFMLSGQDSEQSTNLSMSVTPKSIIDKSNNIDKIEFIVRKIAHLTEYAIGGILFLLLFRTFNISEKKAIIFSEIACVIYAISDEIHQYFVPGRAARIIDVCIDGIGAGLGICIFLLLIKLLKIKKFKVNLINI